MLERTLENLGDLRLAGFLTVELREHGQRVGFEAMGLGGRSAILAHVRFRSPVSVGRYGVEPDRLVPLIEEELVRMSAPMIVRPVPPSDSSLLAYSALDCRLYGGLRNQDELYLLDKSRSKVIVVVAVALH